MPVVFIESLIYLCYFFITFRRFNYIKLSGGWNANARDSLVQRCRSRGLVFYCWHFQWRYRAADLNYPNRGHRRVHVHRAQWWGTSLPYGPRYNSGRRCYHGKKIECMPRVIVLFYFLVFPISNYSFPILHDDPRYFYVQ